MTSPPPCSRLGPQCRALPVTLVIGGLDEGQESLDHEATWLVGHTQRISFARLRRNRENLLVDAVLHVPCRFLQENGEVATCRAHGFRGPPPREAARQDEARRLGGDRFRVVDNLRIADRQLPVPPRSLPVLSQPNPCAGVACRTADNVRQAACCRDLQVEILCTPKQRRLESLVRSRKRPYLSKVTRPGPRSIEAEVISACGYLEEDGISCGLHGRYRADGRPAKPDLCSEWPDDGVGEHPGCRFK